MRIFSVSLLLLLSLNALAANMRFLKNSVLSELSKDEIRSFKNFVADAMDEIPDKEVAHWKSESSTATGKLKSRFTYTMNATTCRRTIFSLSRENRQPEQYQFDICNKDGKWQIMETPAASFSDTDWDIMNARGLEALAFDSEGQPFTWHNAKTGNSGVIVPMAASHADNKTCRELAISISDKKGLASNGAYTFCRTSGGKWKRVIEEP